MDPMGDGTKAPPHQRSAGTVVAKKSPTSPCPVQPWMAWTSLQNRKKTRVKINIEWANNITYIYITYIYIYHIYT